MSRVARTRVPDEAFAVRDQHVDREDVEEEVADGKQDPERIVEDAVRDNEVDHFGGGVS